MSLNCAGHLRAWLLEEVEGSLVDQPGHIVRWAEQLASSLWSELSVEELLLEAAFCSLSGSLG